ncbi:hypothetical protein [Thalassoroseus pseudoceratinae]|uniref:hypothetical protein n=1 Tax=Thalassoroseus pseudoceratinae TaxID=2713176 RepID=UPI001421DB4F|nr:hypothetical protein [Thalassoroseus pseudoceratinae]
MKRIFQLQLGLLLIATSAGCSCLHTGELGCLQAYYGGGVTCRKDCDDDDCLIERLFSCGDGACVVTPAGLPPMQCVQPYPVAPPCGPMPPAVGGPLSPITLPARCTPGTVCPPTPCPPTSCGTGACPPPAIPTGMGTNLQPGVFRGTIPTGFVQGQVVSSQPVASAGVGQPMLSSNVTNYGPMPSQTAMMPQTTMAPQMLHTPPATNFGGCPTGTCGETEIPNAPVPSYPEIFQPQTTEYYDAPTPMTPDQFQMPQNSGQPGPAMAPHPVPMAPHSAPGQPMPNPMNNGQPMGPSTQPMPMNPQPMPMDGGQTQPTATHHGPQGQNWIPVGF